jgi:nucleotide-binding universal stress UspA family protein
VPIDGSPLSERILPIACGGLGAATVTLVRVVEPPGLFAGADAPPPVALVAAAEVELDALAERLRERWGLAEVRTRVRRGAVAPAILEAAAETRCSLIALTTHGRSGFDRAVLGSVAERVIRAAPVPVLALRADDAAPAAPLPPALFERVLIPHDGSPMASRAIEVLSRFDGARRSRVTLLRAIDLPIGVISPATQGLVAELLLAERDHIRDELEVAAGRARALGFEASAALELGPPAAAVLDRAEALAASLVAMATHGRAGPSRWVLGSVTERVLRAATAPLLICR